MGWQPGQEPDGGTGPEPGAARAALLAGFAHDGEWGTRPPSAALAVALEEASGQEWRCVGADHDELTGMLRQWAALESWAAAGKLGVLRALMREEDMPPAGGHHADLPDGWTKSLTHEAALALGLSAQGADTMMWVAWDLQARIPGIGALLADGTLSYGKVRAVDEELNQVTDTHIEQAERLVLARLGENGAVKSFSQLIKIAAQAAVTVEPDIAARRRKDAEETRARVDRWRERSGAAALSGRDLPTDETLAAYANVAARADEYQASGAFPGVRMDQFRAMAYLDLLNGVPAGERIAHAQATAETSTPDTSDTGAAGMGFSGMGTAGTGTGETDTGAWQECACQERDGRCVPADDDDEDQDPAGPDGEDPDGEDPDGDGSGPGPHGGGPGSGPSGSGGVPSSPGVRPRLSDLVIPLATLLGLADRPGEGHGLGPLDPGLCRDLAALAAGSPHSQFCVTVTDPDGIAIGHGCARLSRAKRTSPDPAQARSGKPPQPALPARVNLTIRAAQLPELAEISRTLADHGPAGPVNPRAPGNWAFTPRDDPGPPDGYGTWTLTLPGGEELTAVLHAVPTFDCDHRNESHAYRPNDALRHLVQIRDYECTLPVCSRHARDSDFEHAVPYDKGGRTCACNAGARSRQCHRIKQSPGWTVTQPRPGWHRWETPSGRTYTQGPKQYPA